jgi:hypothetical protein
MSFAGSGFASGMPDADRTWSISGKAVFTPFLRIFSQKSRISGIPVLGIPGFVFVLLLFFGFDFISAKTQFYKSQTTITI